MDWDEDGDLDLLVGDRAGYITYFENTGTRQNPQLTNRGHLLNGTSELNVGNNAAPCVYDWNQDGKKDLIVGIENYEVRLFLNNGSNTSPSFNGYSVIVRKAISTQYGIMRNHPQIADLNKDGRFDLIVGEEYGTIHFFRNTGTNSNPVFYDSEQLKLTSGAVINPDFRAHIELIDWNEDGNLDLIVGTNGGYVYYFKNASSPVPVDPPDYIPKEYALEQNYPNPFNPVTRISFQIPERSFVNISVYDLTGRRVAELYNETAGAGKYSVNFDGRGIASGIYIITMNCTKYRQSRKMILIK